MAFKLSISFAFNLAANFGCNRFWITPDIVSNILRATIWSCCAVQFESEQTPFPRTCRRFRSAANMMFCSHIIFLPRDQWLTERLSEAMGCIGCCFGRQQLLSYSIEIFISHEKKWLVAAQNLQSIETLLTLVLSQYRKSGSMFSWSEPVAASSDCRLLGKRPVFVLVYQTRASRVRELPQELGRWFCPLNLRLPSGTAFGEITRWLAGAQTWTQIWTLPPNQRVVKVL